MPEICRMGDEGEQSEHLQIEGVGFRLDLFVCFVRIEQAIDKQLRETYHLRRQQRHPRRDPPALTRPQHKYFTRNLAPLAQRLEHLEVHDGRIPISPVLGLGARLAVAQQLDGDEVHAVGQVLVGVLRAVEVGVRQERIDHYESRFGGVQVARGLVGGDGAVEVWHGDVAAAWHD